MKGGGKRKKVTPEAPMDFPSAADGGGAAAAAVTAAVDFAAEPFAAPVAEIERTPSQRGEGEDEGEETRVEDSFVEGEEHDEEMQDADAAAAETGTGQNLLLEPDYYEVEAIRRKRVHKGQTQYLIKWLGWSEAANTWEPRENLDNVAEVVAAFDERWETSKHRRRRQKNTIHHSLLKKRQERSVTPYSLRRFPATTANNQTPPAPPPPSGLTYSGGSTTYDIPAFPQPVIFADEAENNSDASDGGRAKHANGNRSANVSEQIVEGNVENDYDPKLSELRAATTNVHDADRLAIQFNETNVASGNCHIDMEGQTNGVGIETAQSSRCRGAKKRKSGSVKRFNRDLYTGAPVNAQNPTGMPDATAEPAAAGIADNVATNSTKNTDHVQPPTIVDILRPINCSPLLPDIKPVVTFVVQRSDGEETIVDNEYFKAHHPHLLIDFYERHLRYNHRT